MVKTRGPLFGPNVSGPIKRRVRKKYPEPTPPDWDLEVSGTLAPDATGHYDEVGTKNGKPYYKHRTQEWYIWYDPHLEPMGYKWRIKSNLVSDNEAHWYKTTEDYEPVVGDYLPAFGPTGTATVATP